MKLKIDLHVHSNYSPDSLITPTELLAYARKCGLDGVAITDHDRIDGASRIAKETDFFVIVGTEISSTDGHIIGLNIKEPISSRLSMEETVDKIHDLGGIAVAPHPIAFLKGGLGKKVSPDFDAVEVMNASAFPFRYSAKHNQQIAVNLGLAQVAGSDAHYAPEIGCAYTAVDAELEVEQVIEAIRKGSCRSFGRAIPVSIRLRRELLLFKRKFCPKKKCKKQGD